MTKEAHKGKKDRLVPMTDLLLRWIDEYLEDTERERGKGKRGPVFLSKHRGFSDQAITPSGVRHVLKKAATSIGITGKSVSPHSLRHSFAIWALREGASVKHVQKFLGHSSIETTNRYLEHLELGELRAALPKLPTT
jgi:integrase/recombinase XerD